MSISVVNLTKRFNGNAVVKDLSFDARENGVIGFLGPNGAGKSTTMKMITGFLHPDEGKIQVCGIDVNTRETNYKKKIGYLPEGNPLYYEMYVREYLNFVGAAQQIENAAARIEEVITTTGLTPESNKKTGELSKGYKQRVGLAAAILHDPEVLILDEPTSGLDPNQIIEIRALIKNLGKTKTVLFSSHILQEVESICDRVIIINKGEIVADDQLQNLKSVTSTNSLVVVKFSNQPPEDWYLHWPEVEKAESSNGFFYFETQAPDKLKKQILTFALENDLEIDSIESQTKSLEEIFKDLTIKKNELTQ